MADPLWLSKKRNKLLADKHENFVAAVLHGRKTLKSGTYPQQKGDVDSERFLIECKMTRKNSFVLKRETLRKVEKEAWNVGKCPALVVKFQNNEEQSNYIIIKLSDFLTLEMGV